MLFFKQRKLRQEVQAFMRRIVDLSTPALRHEVEEYRKERRANRSLPVLVVPFVENEPVMSNTTFGVSRNLSSSGISLLVQEMVDSDEVVVGFWADGKCDFLRGQVRHRSATDGGFWHIGIELAEVLHLPNWSQLAQLAKMAERLTASETDESYAVTSSK